jgi:hypothetical protein
MHSICAIIVSYQKEEINIKTEITAQIKGVYEIKK